ncbi:MAG: TetR/AcrR family transcriptional regulator [Candidatus Sericytochromatia bacterium]
MDKKEIIIASAIKRFRHYGVSKTTMQEIANDCNIAVGTLYLYFKNKGDIVIACANEYAKLHKKQAQEIINSNINSKEKIKLYLLERFNESKRTRTSSPHDIEITKAVLKYYPTRIKEEAEWMYENLFFILKDGIKKGELNSEFPEKDIEVLLYSLVYFFPLAGQLSEEPNEDKYLDLIDWFINLWSIN